MRFEEILPLLKEGKKARVNEPNTKDCWYGGTWQCCWQSLIIESKEEKWLSMCCLDENGKVLISRNSYAIPIMLILSDKWELVDCDLIDYPILSNAKYDLLKSLIDDVVKSCFIKLNPFSSISKEIMELLVSLNFVDKLVKE